MGRFSKLERETQDALARQKALEEKSRELPSAPQRPAVEEYDAPYYIEKGDDAFFLGVFKEALQYYSRALQMDNSSFYPWLGQIYCLIEMGQYKEADLWTGRALEMFPEDSSLLSLRAMMYARRGMYKRALNTTDYAISRKGANAHSYIARGYVLLAADNKNANFCFTKAMELASPSDWKIPMRIGLIYFKNKKYSRGLEFLLKACALNVTNYYLWFHLGQCYVKLGFTKKAIEAYQHSLEQNPDYVSAKEAYVKLTRSSVFSRLMSRLVSVLR